MAGSYSPKMDSQSVMSPADRRAIVAATCAIPPLMFLALNVQYDFAPAKYLVWLTLGATVTYVVVFIWRARRVGTKVQRLQRGDCVSCGYAGSGLAPDAACPECGKLRA